MKITIISSIRACRYFVQAVSLLFFLVLFFYVCCPYAGLVMEKSETASPIQQMNAPAMESTDNDDFDAELNVEVSSPAMILEESPKFPDHYAVSFREKSEYVVPYLFLALDPSVAVTVLASQDWGAFRSAILLYAGIALILSLVFARCFCGYICPMGTIIDMTDRLFARIPVVNYWRNKRKSSHTEHCGIFKWQQLRFGVLLVLLVSALFGVVLIGYVSPIPLVTRNIGFIFSPFQTAYYRGWHQVPPYNITIWISIVIFCGILVAGLFIPRFFCRFICPSGAFFSLINSAGTLFSSRTNATKCVKCRRCASVCNTNAISAETFTAIPSRCISCQSCVEICPTKAIRYGVSQKKDTPETTSFNTRRYLLKYGLIYGGIGTTLAYTISRCFRSNVARDKALIRPPGSLDEERFLQLCVRCGACFRACPNDALQPCSLEYGLESLWTPRLNANWSGCEPSCNNCGGVCPSGAIQSLSFSEKRSTVIGIACVDRTTCLPYAGKEECRLCHDECQRAGYNAIEFMQVGTEVDFEGQPIEGSGFTAPVILEEKCVGCGLCQSRCNTINVKTKQLLTASAVLIFRDLN